MKIGELRAMTDQELSVREGELRQQLQALRFTAQSGQLDNVNRLRDTRREIARIRTLLRERALGIHQAASQAK